MATLTINHYINQANSFISDIRNNRNAYYVFAARSQPWTNSSGINDDSSNSVLAANNSTNQVEQIVYNDILYGKLLSDSDVNNLIPRYNWTANTVYSVYSATDSGLYEKQFYVVTDKYEVYKCIDNNNGVTSYIKPSLTTPTGTFKTGDGYVWKYMYTIDSTSNTKFTTSNFIPVIIDPVVQGNTTPGTIDVIDITNGGSGYYVYENGYINNLVDNYTIQLPSTASSIDNYYTNSSIYLKSGFGAGQIREIKSSNGSSKQIVVNSPFTSYVRLDLANVVGSVTTGYFVDQPYDNINYLYAQGYFNTYATVSQSDTGATGTIVASNTTVIQVSRNNTNSQFSLNYPIVDISQAGTVKTGTVSVGNTGACNLAIVTSAGTGYTGNTTVTIIDNGTTGVGAVANAQATSGKITSINISTPGTGYFVSPTITVAQPTAQTFNANTDVTAGTGSGSNNIIALATANSFAINDLITYTVSAGNTAIGGLSSGASYYIEFANSTVISLKTTISGSRISLTKGQTQSGHVLQGQTATGTLYCDNQIIYGSGTQLNSTANGYSNGEYIRVGANTVSNIRRVINNVNTTVIIADLPFNKSFNASSNAHYKMPTVLEPSSVVIYGANGYVSNTNLTSVKISISNSSLSGTTFIVGEKVDMTNSSRVNQNANGIVAFANSSSILLSGVVGTWTTTSNSVQLFVSGQSSLQLSQISGVESNPNITINNPTGTFKLGYPVFFRIAAGGTISGNAVISSKTSLPNDQTQYQIGPTVKILGDGSNAVAIAVVNTATGSQYSITSIDVINPGFGYTQANVSIYANTNYGSNATAVPIVSPVNGHGYDAVRELGGRYVGINTTFDTIYNESYGLLGYGSYRKIGILQNPQFKDVKITLSNFDRSNFTLSGYSTTLGWSSGEVVLQTNTNASGVVVFGNSSFLQLKNVKGTFNTANTIKGYYSNSIANVVTANTIYFPVGNTAEIVTESNSGAMGIITSAISNTVYFMSNVVGQFATNDTIYDSVVNAYATVSSIYTANGSKDSSVNFGSKFNQTARITLTANNGSFANNEYVKQSVSLASGRVVSSSDEKDLVFTGITGGSFSVGQTLTDATTGAFGICTFANTTYAKLTNISQVANFGMTNTLKNGLGVTAIISFVYPVLVLNDVSDVSNFQAGSNIITGNTSGATATCNNYLLITNPDLVRDSGKLLYSESFTPVTRAPATTEEFKIILKF